MTCCLATAAMSAISDAFMLSPTVICIITPLLAAILARPEISENRKSSDFILTQAPLRMMSAIALYVFFILSVIFVQR